MHSALRFWSHKNYIITPLGKQSRKNEGEKPQDKLPGLPGFSHNAKLSVFYAKIKSANR